MKNLPFLFLAFLFFSCQNSISENNTETSNKELHALFAEEWGFRDAQNNPELLPDVTIEAQEKRADFWKNTLEKLTKIDRESLWD